MYPGSRIAEVLDASPAKCEGLLQMSSASVGGRAAWCDSRLFCPRPLSRMGRGTRGRLWKEAPLLLSPSLSFPVGNGNLGRPLA